MKEVFVVDLDHSLIRTDLLHEQILWLIKQNPLTIFLLPLWLLQGRAGFKSRLAARVALRPETLPYRQDLLEEIRKRRADGHITVLASASHIDLLKPIGAHLNLFDRIIGTSGEENLKGRAKLVQIQSFYPNQDLIYVGDSSSDYEIWKHSSSIIAVNPSRGLKKKLAGLDRPLEFIQDRKPLWRSVLKAIRAHQWSKNVLIFTPLVGAHKILDPTAVVQSLLAFVAFSFTASTVYIFNDLLDLESDRMHSTKRNRPFASGALTIPQGLLLVLLLLAAAFTICAFLPLAFLGMISGYLFLNALYTLRLKSVLVVDVVLLASMYTIRILAGGAATDIRVTHWLLAFSTFMFFGLAIAKRVTEIVKNPTKALVAGRGYGATDREALLALGTASSLLSVLILVLYLNSGDVVALYAHPERLWLVTPICLWWIGRIWILTMRGAIHDDPVVFTLKDPQSWLAGLLFSLTLYAAI